MNSVTLCRWITVNPRPAGGTFERPPPSGFSRIAKIRRALRAAGFSPTLPPSFPQLLWKFRPNAMWGQATRSGQVTQLQNKLPNRATATMFQGKLWNFQNMMSSSVPTKHISRIFYIGDLRSCHFCDLPITSQWEKINSVIFTLAQAYLSVIISYRTVVDNSRKNLHCLPLERSFEVTRGPPTVICQLLLIKKR